MLAAKRGMARELYHCAFSLVIPAKRRDRAARAGIQKRRQFWIPDSLTSLGFRDDLSPFARRHKICYKPLPADSDPEFP
jgi:hypothetical protein